MLRVSFIARHGPLTYNIGSSSIRVGRELQAMLPSNSLMYEPAKMRHRLDKDGYLFFKNIIPKPTVSRALSDVATQMLSCGWTNEKDLERMVEHHGFPIGIPAPTSEALPPPDFTLSDNIKTATVGSNVMATVRQVFGGAVEHLPYHALDFSPPQEAHGFRMSSVYMNRGTKLALIAWVPLHDTPLNMGGLCVVRGSNSAPQYANIRETYGSIDIEGSGISGDGSFTMDANELLPLGKHADAELGGMVDDTPLVSTTFEAGDIVLMTVYTMYGYLTNRTTCWRVSNESRWIMEGDDVGPDPRYVGDAPIGMSNWLAERDDPVKYPKSMTQAKREWGLIPEAPKF